LPQIPRLKATVFAREINVIGIRPQRKRILDLPKRKTRELKPYEKQERELKIHELSKNRREDSNNEGKRSQNERELQPLEGLQKQQRRG